MKMNNQEIIKNVKSLSLSWEMSNRKENII